MTKGTDTTPTSQSESGLQTTLPATKQKTEDVAKAAAKQKKLFPTRVILPTKRPKATHNRTSSSQAGLADST